MSRWITKARRWIADADEDLKVAQDLISSTHYAASCFHSQQAGEKAVKACFLCSRYRGKRPLYNRIVESFKGGI